MTENAQQQRQQQQLSPEQRLARVGTAIREVQNWMELNYPHHGQANQMLREAGDLVTEEIQRMLQQQQRRALSPISESVVEPEQPEPERRSLSE